MVYVEWLLRPMSMVPGVRTLVNGHPGTEESEELRVTIAFSAAIANVIWLDQLCCMDSLRLDKQMYRVLGGTGQARWEGKCF